MFNHSKIGVRLFVLFLLSAVIPVITTIAYFGSELKSLSKQHLEQQLSLEARNFAETIENKLLAADTILGQIAPEIFLYDKERLSTSLHQVFSSVSVSDDQRKWKTILGDAPFLVPAPTPEKAERLTILRQENGAIDVALYQHDISNAPARSLAGIIKPEFLWLNEVSNSDTHYAIYVNGQRIVSLKRDDRGRELLILNNRDEFALKEQNPQLVTRSKRLSLSTAYGATPWYVSVSRHSDSVTLTSAKSAQALTVIAFAILLLVTLVSSRQIRRIVAPLAKLTHATQRLAKQNFYEPLHIDSNDEIGQLAKSFNSMSEKLGTQFRTLEGLTIIDDSILTGEDIRSTSELILREICGIFNCQQSMLCLIPEKHGQQIQSLRYDSAAASITKLELLKPAILNDSTLPTRQQTKCYELSEGFPKLFHKLSDANIAQILICPVVSNKLPIAYIAVGFAESRNNIDLLIAPLESFSRRIGVAIRATRDTQKLYRRANYDPLTNLHNRAHFIEQLNAGISKAEKDGKSFVLMFIDLDRFKHVNDVQGHEAGDKLLKYVAKKLVDSVIDDAITARFGGDEFLIILPEVSSLKYAQIIARTIIDTLSQPIVIDFHEHFINASIGIAMYPDHGKSAEILIKNTDIAMYRAKRSGGGNHRVFDSQMNAQAMKRIALESALYRAIERNELFLVYQPKLCLQSGQVCGAEALIRWQHPIHGLIAPDQFITIAEETGQILPIGKWVVRSVIQQIAAWNKQGMVLEHIAINASVRQIKSEGFADELKLSLEEYAVDPKHIEIEITETMFIDDMENSIKVLKKLRQIGVSIAIDDFGTGYSSLNYLSRLPFDTLKIDRSFLERVHQDDNAASLTSAIIALAHSLDKMVVAEGVETREQLQFLHDRHCDQAQGFYYTKPLLADDFERYADNASASGNILLG